MEASLAKTLWVLTVIALIWMWKVLNRLWLTPKRLERKLREQGLQGTSYRILFGDTKEMFERQKDAKSKPPMNLSDDIVPRVYSFVHGAVNKYDNAYLHSKHSQQVTPTYIEEEKGNSILIFAELASLRFSFANSTTMEEELIKSQSVEVINVLYHTYTIIKIVMAHVKEKIGVLNGCVMGKNSFIWSGTKPTVIITDPEQIKDVFHKINDFTKPETIPIWKLLFAGLVTYDGEKWAKHRKIINPAFHVEKLKIMLPAFLQSCNDMISKWEGMLSSNGLCDVDVWSSLQTMTCDVISRTAFGSSYEEGTKIFQLLKEQASLTIGITYKYSIPGYRFLPIDPFRRMKENHKDIVASLKKIISKGENALKAGEANMDNLLGMLLESNWNEIQDHKNNKNDGMTIEDVIEECKLFYFAGQETTSSLLVWTMVLLSRYNDWQARARDEVFQVFGNQSPDFDGLNRLKVVTMILHEVLRLYPPVINLARATNKELKLGNLTIPAGVHVSLPIILIHHDHQLWGDDAKEFNPERFSEGVSKATKGRVSFFPFGWGPRICIGQNFALLEAKIALSMILQHFSFELSPTYTHAPITVVTLQPQRGANLVLHKLKT